MKYEVRPAKNQEADCLRLNLYLHTQPDERHLCGKCCKSDEIVTVCSTVLGHLPRLSLRSRYRSGRNRNRVLVEAHL